ncbi:replication protein [Serratia fonticola]|uniref:replication protein n=1 Tax=Serratia fonticola TaxID=47917 RepID=UPI0027EA0503|nr:replication protein [Serratia fonticola]MDQ7209044.1 replication protein [Serratia fonticola]
MNVARHLTLVSTSPEVVEHRVAQLEDGFTRVANELLDAVMASGLSETEMCVVLAVWRKTYGYSKKMDWISNEQLEAMIGKHLTHCSTAKNLLINKKVLLQEGRKVGMNTNVAGWKTKINGFCKTLAKPAKKTLAEVAKSPLQKVLTTKDNIQKIKENTPLTPQGGEDLAQECLDYYNEINASRCSATAPFEKALSTVKAKGVCYSADEVKLVIRWISATWKHKATPENICRMTRFSGYLSDALIWESGVGRNPEPCPHETLIGLWNTKFPTKAIALQEWNRRRPAYGNLEAVWNGKTNSGNWREAKHIGTAFDLISKSALFSDADNKPWLTLDWILSPKNWGQVYEQAINEHKLKRGMQ